MDLNLVCWSEMVVNDLEFLIGILLGVISLSGYADNINRY